MTNIEHLIATRRTWKYLDLEENMKHAILGIGSEIGELMSAYKKAVFKEQPIDIVNCVEEIGDALYFIARVVDELELNKDCLNPSCKKYNISNNKIDFLFTLMYVSQELSMSIIAGYTKDEIEDDIKYLVSLYNILLKDYGCPIELCRDINIQKLMIRWPEKFDELQDSKDRDLVAEYEDMKIRLQQK